MGDRQTAERYPDTVTVVDTSGGTPAPANPARVLLVDDATVLMSTLEADVSADGGRVEAGMWTADTGLGRMPVGIMDGAMSDTHPHAPDDGWEGRRGSPLPGIVARPATEVGEHDEPDRHCDHSRPERVLGRENERESDDL